MADPSRSLDPLPNAQYKSAASKSVIALPLAATAAVAAAAALAVSVRHRVALIASAEELFDGAEEQFAAAMAAESEDRLRAALASFEGCLALAALSGDASVPAEIARWLARPLRLRAMHRVAAARELLHESPRRIAEAHAALIDEGYCQSLHDEASLDRAVYARCLAPHARGTIAFAASPAEADRAFAAATSLTLPQGGAALTWTSRWQLPDHHTPGLTARPWWDAHPAVAALESHYGAALADCASCTHACIHSVHPHVRGVCMARVHRRGARRVRRPTEQGVCAPRLRRVDRRAAQRLGDDAAARRERERRACRGALRRGAPHVRAARAAA